MKKAALLFAAFTTITIGLAAPVFASEPGLTVQVQSGWGNDDHRGNRSGNWNQHNRNDRGNNWKRPGFNRGDIISPRRISFMLQRQGFNIDDIRFERGQYLVRAARHNGRRVMLIVDARSGNILAQRAIRGYRHTNF